MTGSWQHWDIATILNTYLFQALLERKTKTHKQNQTWWRSGPGTLAGWELVCACVCVRLLLTEFDTRTAADATLCQPSRCWGVQWCFCVCVCTSIYVFFLPLPVCQKCVSPITCLSDNTVECGNAHLTHCLRRSSRGVCVCVYSSHSFWVSYAIHTGRTKLSSSRGPPLLGLVTACGCS